MVGDLEVGRYEVTGGVGVTKHWLSDRVGKAMDICVWTEDEPEGGWIGTCRIKWDCGFETPKRNGMNFCPKCGKRLKQKERAK